MSGSDGDSSSAISSDKWKDRKIQKRADRSPRTEYERDRDKVLYSDGFHRLKGITQVARSGENYPYHTRLTHSLKVSQVGRRIAQYLDREYEDTPREQIAIPEVVSAAALAHDLGHPPFGHAAEKELDYLIRDKGADDGFEGNPQSFRIINHIETNALYQDSPDDTGKGLNLTKRTLNAVLKYPWSRGDDIPAHIGINPEMKFGCYSREIDIFEWAREGVRSYERTPEAELMDWADDVTYAVHDLVDFYRVGVIPLGEIFQDTAERAKFIEHFENEYSDDDSVSDEFDPEEFLDDKLKGGLNEPEIKRKYEPTRVATSLVDLLQSDLIGDFLSVPETISYEPPSQTGFEDGLGAININPNQRSQVEFLKEITFYYVIRSPSLKSQQHGERTAVATIFDAFLAASDDEYARDHQSEFSKSSEYDIEMVPHPFREDLKTATTREERARIIGDAITCLTENQAIALYERISGFSPGSLTEQVF